MEGNVSFRVTARMFLLSREFARRQWILALEYFNNGEY